MMRVAAIAVLAALAGPAQADVRIEVDSSTYKLTGTTTKEIHEDMDRKAREGGEVVEGETKDSYSLSLDLAKGGDVCRLGADEVLLQLEIRLPEWVDEGNADPSVRAAWNTYFGKLKAHEDGHKDIAIETARRIDRAVHQAKPRGSCDAFEAYLRESADRIVEAAESRQERFDASQVPFGLGYNDATRQPPFE